MADERDPEEPTLPSARAPHTREDADAGVRDCLDLMTSGRWITGTSHRTVADAHGVHPDTVKKWATNASRIIRFAIEGDVEDIRARMLATLDTVVAKAMTYERTVPSRDGPVSFAQPDLRAVVSAIEVQAKLLGLVTQKHEVAFTEDEARKIIADAKALIAGDADGSKT